MRDGHDALIVTTGIGLQICLAAADRLTAMGIDATVLHLPTIKPLDTEAIAAARRASASDCIRGGTQHRGRDLAAQVA